MTFLSGIISDRLRAKFTADEILNNPHPDRSASPTAKPVSQNVDGKQVGKKPGRTTKK